MTKKDAKSAAKKALDALVEHAGSQRQLSRMLTQNGNRISPQTVQAWILRGQISKPGVFAVQDNKDLKDKFPPTELRPGIGQDEWDEYIKNFKKEK